MEYTHPHSVESRVRGHFKDASHRDRCAGLKIYFGAVRNARTRKSKYWSEVLKRRCHHPTTRRNSQLASSREKKHEQDPQA
jgi:hypothetical protein